MAQLSRPYQIGLAGIVLLAAVWVLALRGHSNSSPSTSSQTPPSAATHSSSAPTAPGVAGLSKDVAKAHEAVATSERNAKQLQRKSEQASSAGSSSASTTHSAAPSHAASKPSTSTSTPTKPGSAARGSISARQHAAEAALKKGDVLVLLFWDKHGSDDVAVQKAVQSLKGASKVFTSQAGAGQVASYGSITRGIQVYGTPTILIVNPKGKTITLTGLQDAYAIRQAIAEARHL